MRRTFFTLDVFTQTRFAGNPLAVVLQSAGLDDATMQAIAREFNLPETVFVMTPDDAAHRARLRIFTPAIELPFAGHPTVGAAVLLAQLDGGARQFVLEETVGPVACRYEAVDRDRGQVTFALPALPQEAGAAPDVESIAGALGIHPSDIGYEGHVPSRWSAGLAFSFVPIRSLEAIGRCRPDPARFESVFAIGGPGKVYLYGSETVDRDNDFHARMFAPGAGIPEDPATGSAAAGLAGLLAATGRYGDGDQLIRIEQGIEMGRPSLILAGLTIRDGMLVAGSIGGHAVVVSEGTIEA